MKIFKFAVFAALLIIVENIWPAGGGPVRPDLFLLLAVTFSVYSSVEKGIALSFAAGFIQDVLFSINFLNTLVKTGVSAIIFIIKDKLILDFDKLSFILIAVFSPLAVLAKALLGFILYRNAIRWFDLLIIIFTTTVFNLLIAPAFLFLVKKFDLYAE